METVIKDSEFTRIAESVKPDAKRRVVLSKLQIREGVTYRVYSNRLGQIVLDPQVTIPASEIWLFENPEAFASVRRGIADASKDKVSKIKVRSL